jgi:hypothetical protein
MSQEQRDAARLAANLTQAGFDVRYGAKNHYLARVNGGVVSWAASPSDWRWVQNTASRLKKLGVKITKSLDVENG